MHIKSCLICNSEFKSPQSKAKYCSKICCVKAGVIQRRQAVSKTSSTCLNCGIIFYKKLSNNNTGKYCSRGCSDVALRKIKTANSLSRTVAMFSTITKSKVCKFCDKIFLGSAQQLYCSDECIKAVHRKSALIADMGKTAVLKHMVCRECGKSLVYEYGDKRRTFCSKRCSNRNSRRNENMSKKANIYRVKYERIYAYDIFKRDSYKCNLCGDLTLKNSFKGRISGQHPVIGMIVPMASGGSYTESNVACYCKRCYGIYYNDINTIPIPPVISTTFPTVNVWEPSHAKTTNEFLGKGAQKWPDVNQYQQH